MRVKLNRHTRTPEQQAFYDSMLKKKPKTIRRRESFVPSQKETTTIEYMRNCMWWIEEFLQGGTTEEKFKSALKSLTKLAYELHYEQLKSQEPR